MATKTQSPDEKRKQRLADAAKAQKKTATKSTESGGKSPAERRKAAVAKKTASAKKPASSSKTAPAKKTSPKSTPAERRKKAAASPKGKAAAKKAAPKKTAASERKVKYTSDTKRLKAGKLPSRTFNRTFDGKIVTINPAVGFGDYTLGVCGGCVMYTAAVWRDGKEHLSEVVGIDDGTGGAALIALPWEDHSDYCGSRGDLLTAPTKNYSYGGFFSWAGDLETPKGTMTTINKLFKKSTK